MIYLRDMARAAMVPMEFDLTAIAAVTEDALRQAIIARDPAVVGSAEG